MTTDETLNELLVRLFKDIMEIEGKCLCRKATMVDFRSHPFTM